MAFSQQDSISTEDKIKEDFDPQISIKASNL